MCYKNTKIIKVCIVSHWGYPLYNKKCKDTFGGGSAVQLYLLSKAFANNKNFNIHIMTGNHDMTKNRIEFIENILLYSILPIKRTFLNYFRYILNIFKYLILINPDVVIQRGSGVKTGLIALYCKLFKKKFIYSVASAKDVNGVSERGLKGKFFKFGIDNADFIVAQNDDHINELETYKQKKFKNLKVIRSGYEINEIDIKFNESILWVGRAIKLKRPDLFLKLAQKFPNEKFIIICYKRKKDIDYWKSIYNEAKKIFNLEFIEFVPFHKIANYFKEAKIFINTSTYEGFPNTFIQAFMNKIPVISLNVDPDDIITENKTGFFCNDDFNKMEENLKLILENKELYKQYSNNSYNYAKKNHDIKKISDEWFLLIREQQKKKKNY